VPARAGARGYGGRVAAIALVAFGASQPAAVADEPSELLRRMSLAIEDLSYQGVLVHVHGGDSVVLDIAHRVQGGKVTERIKARNGEREIIRNGNEVQCIFPDQRTVWIEERDGFGDVSIPLVSNLLASGVVDGSLYHLALNGSERVAKRETRGIAIRPKDGFRYGYTIALDKATAMPLKTQLVDENGAVLETVLFTEISLPAQVPDDALRPSVDITAFARRRMAETLQPRDIGRSRAGWSSRDLPPGFRLLARPAALVSGPGPLGAHTVYSDGLATVSLFVEPAVAASEQAEGLSVVGAANAFTVVLGGYMVTAVGEVPARTVEIIARSAQSERLSQ